MRKSANDYLTHTPEKFGLTFHILIFDTCEEEKCHNPLKILGCGTSCHGIDIW